MKISVLLPTRNRLDLLVKAVESVRRQDYDDWEIVISDNASTEDVAGYVAGLDDSRVRLLRSHHVLSVTENWNRALDASAGDYVVMLGDDDALLKGYMRTLADEVIRLDRPEVIYTEAVQYAYPNVFPWHPDPFVQIAYCGFMKSAQPFKLDRSLARACVDASLRFQITFGFNMQYFLVSQEVLTRLRRDGSFYHSPYPDYYAANALLLNASSIVVHPSPIVVIGISPKSFGYFYFNDREREGGAMLKNQLSPELFTRLERWLVPGEDMNTNYLAAMEMLVKHFGADHDLHVRYENYRFTQFRSRYNRRRSYISFMKDLAKDANLSEFAQWFVFKLRAKLGMRDENAVLDQIHVKHPPFDARIQTVGCNDVLELVDRWPYVGPGRAAYPPQMVHSLSTLT
jgi:glycosyltransferase involved in cell wall biosynthesis